MKRALRKTLAAGLAAVLALMTAGCGVKISATDESQLQSIAESLSKDVESIAASMAGEVESVAESMAQDTSKTAESVADSTALNLAEALENSVKERQEKRAAEDAASEGADAAEKAAADGSESEGPAAEKNGDVYILFTSDIHCGVDEGFGLAGLEEIRSTLESKGYTVLLVDDGDAIQGEALGTLSKGESIIELMNEMHYDAAIPGNHEYDYGMERFLELAEKAEFPYISCNFNKEGELLFEPYIIREAAGMKIAFVGVTTPQTLVSSTTMYFQDDDGNLIYGFLQDESGEKLYEAVQKAVDSARAEGADYVYLIGHLGLDHECTPWTYADVLSHTNGIDVLLDGHSHDTEQIVMKNKDGDNVVRSACGTKLNSIGYSHISASDGIVDTNIWTWPNKQSLPELTGLHNRMSDAVAAEKEEIEDILKEVVAQTKVDLTIFDPVEKDTGGNPIRMVRRAETNLGDLVADAYRAALGADIGISNAGNIRADIAKGDITYENIMAVNPFNSQLCMVEATGQQILDALEWTSRAVPDENGGFLQVSGMSYEIDVNVESGCESDENGMMTGISGERRVKNVLVGGEPINPDKLYTVAAIDYVLLLNGDGMTAFDGAKLLQDRVKLDNQALIEYISEGIDEEGWEAYVDPYGQGRITIIE